MKPYLLKVPLIRKEPEIHFDTCQVDHVITLSEPAFREFQHNLMTDRDFLREFNREYASSYTEGVRPGILVLGEGFDDGIFVCTEGYDYARYSAYIPNARQLLLMKEYPILQDYTQTMAEAVARRIQKAINTGLPDAYRFSLQDMSDASNYSNFNAELFLDMIGSRPEVVDMEVDRDEVLLTIAPEYLPKRNQALRTITPEDLKVACARHLLWNYDAGGEQADFSNCNFDHADFSGLELNGAIFDGSVFRNCNLSNASLCFASFKGCTFVGCNCENITAEEAVFQEAVFSDCRLDRAILTHSDFTRTVLQDSTFQNASMKNCLIEQTQFEDVQSGGTDFDGTTEDAPSWFHQPPSDLSMEEIQ